jgi:hypothetical protein
MGTEPLKSSFRHNFFPVASKQERIPCAPSVTTLPSATVGELLGPWNPESPPPRMAGDSYFSCQTSLPSEVLRQRMTSSPPCRVKT